MTAQQEREAGLKPREEVWLRAWLAVAGTFNGKAPDCTRYADDCLAQFDKRFGDHIENKG